MKTFSQKTAWGTTIDGLFLTDLQTLQVCRMEEGCPEPCCTAAVTLPGLLIGEVAIKNYSENQGILDALVSAGIVKEPHRYIWQDRVRFPVCILNKDVAHKYLWGGTDMNMKNVPLYKYPFSYAHEHKELDQYRLSNTANLRCRDAIETAIRENYRDNRLNVAGAEQVLAEFGVERTRYVLANTVRHADWDQRYSRANKAWAANIVASVHYEVDPMLGDPTLKYRITQAHPGLVNLFIDQIHRLTEGT